MIIKRYILFCFLGAVFLTACTKEKDILVKSFDDVYQNILNSKYEEIHASFNIESLNFYNKITNPEYLNIDSIIQMGKEYKLPYMLTEYLAYNGDKIKDGRTVEEFYRYLGAQNVSFFSFQDGYYVEKAKLKKGRENFVAIIKEEMTQSKRGWVQFTGNENTGYKLDLLYTLKLYEIKRKKKNNALRNQHQEIKSQEDYLRYFYWQNSGENSNKFESEQLKLEKAMRDGRADLIRSYEERGLKDKVTVGK
jgi:hypothetical protein